MYTGISFMRNLKVSKSKEIALVYLSVSIAVCLLTAIGIFFSSWPWLSELSSLIIAFLFLWVPVRIAQKEANPSKFGISVGGLLLPRDQEELSLSNPTQSESIPVQVLRELGVALAISVIVFPCFALGFWYWFEPSRPFSLTFNIEFLSYFLTQLVVVALPEEVFFRGYLQTRLSEIWSGERTILGLKIHPLAWLVQAALFALMHFLVTLDVTRLAVFFPGLLFGLIRAQRKGIGASTFFHALSNLFSYLLFEGWFS